MEAMLLPPLTWMGALPTAVVLLNAKLGECHWRFTLGSTRISECVSVETMRELVCIVKPQTPSFVAGEFLVERRFVLDKC